MPWYDFNDMIIWVLDAFMKNLALLQSYQGYATSLYRLMSSMAYQWLLKPTDQLPGWLLGRPEHLCGGR